MAEIKWIGTGSNIAWSSSTNWQNGVVPGVNDTAIFTSVANGGGAGNCTLDVESVVGGFKLLADYAGTFSQNANPMTVGNGVTGAFHVLKTGTFNAAVDFYGSDFFWQITTNLPQIRFHSDCDLRTRSDFAAHSVDSDTTVTFRSTPHPEYPAAATGTDFGIRGGTGKIDGTLDLTESAGLRFTYGASLPSYDFSQGYLRNRGDNAVPVTGNFSAITVGRLDGLFDLAVSLNTGGSTRTITGDLRPFGNVSVVVPSTSQVTTFHLANTIIDRLALTLNNATNMTVRLPDESEITGDFIVTETSTGTVTLLTATGGVPNLFLTGTADQIIDVANNAIGIVANKNAGNVTIASGDFHLIADSVFPDGLDFVPYYSGCFKQNGKTMYISSGKLHLLELDPVQYVFSGSLVFSGNDFVLKNTVFPDDCDLVFTSHCTARFISENGKRCSPGGIRVEPNAQLVLTTAKHGNVIGNVQNAIEISGNMTIMGTLGFFDPGQYRVIMSDNEKICQLRKLIAGNNSEIIIEPKSNAVQPMDVEVTGNARLFWGPEIATVRLLPGNNKGFREFCIPSHITECRLSPGEYDFDVWNITTPQTGEILLTQNDTGNIFLRGQTVIAGNGSCRNTIDDLRWEHLQLDAFLQFTSDCMQIDHPVVLGGNISGNGKLILSGTRPFQLNDDSLDVDELHIYDGDGSFPVPAFGYQSLTLEARNRDSLLALRGEYRIANMTMIADTHTLTVDADPTTTIHCTGDIVTQKSGGGNIRWLGDGLETFVLEGDASQTLDMNFEHGYHVLGTMLNDKSGGTLTFASPLSVVYYMKPDGTPLPAPANMTILSALSLQCQLHLAMGGTGECLSQEGTRLENGIILSGGTIIFYARLADQDGQPIDPKQVSTILMDCRLMNPIAPYLHEPRKTLTRFFALDIPRVLSPGWQTDAKRLPEGQTYNFRLDSAMFRELRFEQPGLYYVTFTVKMFGQKNPVPFRYEIHCERPVAGARDEG